MSTSHPQPSKRLVSPINKPKNTFKKNLALLVFIASVTLLFSSWGSARYSMGGYNAGQLAITDHQLHIGKNILNYKATTGYMPLVDEQSKPLANIFYVAYTAGSTNDNTRPVTFVFNGGPGSAAIWLHMGSFGPVRVLFKNDKGDAPEKSDSYADNPYSWLGFTDLVFIDPVATGYSRAQEDVNVKHFYNYKNDVASIGEFIRLYLEKNNRQNSPKFLAGESYGAVRAVGLAEYLQDNYKVTLNGITLISPALNYQLIKFNDNNQQPYSYYLPSYAAAAQYHHRLTPALQKLSVQQLIAKVTAFARGSYTLFLSEGNSAPESLTNKVIDSLHYFTGLSAEGLLRAHGRITDNQFCRALLRSDSLTIGTFDSRFTGVAANIDPSESNLRGLFTHAFNNYIINGLQYQNNLPYKATVAIGDWDYGTRKTNSYLDISETLKKVMVQNPRLKINIAAGYYDLATPVNTTAYVIDHMGLPAQLRGNISIDHYESGHMIYISKTANDQFRQNAEKFYQNAL